MEEFENIEIFNNAYHLAIRISTEICILAINVHILYLQLPISDNTIIYEISKKGSYTVNIRFIAELFGPDCVSN